MSELIQKHDNRATIRWKLLTGASALALTAYISSNALAKADDADRPTLWIELGGQAELLQGTSSPFTAPFMLQTPTPGPFKTDSPIDNQRPPRFSFGEDGKITFQPEDSDWIFSASIRYGRSHGNGHTHHQTAIPPASYGSNPTFAKTLLQSKDIEAFLDQKDQYNSQHTVIDFSVGKDVGLGLFGRYGTSTVSAGVRAAELKTSSSLIVYARPNVIYSNGALYASIFPSKYLPLPNFHGYTMLAHADRSFKGVGPTLSWNASAALVGNPEHGEITLDWGVNGALLFGKQKAKTEHSVHSYAYAHTNYLHYPTFVSGYNKNPPPSIRSRRVTVPDVGGFIGLSVKSPHTKISFGYRGEIFFKAMDRGIDAAEQSNVTFNGPYASISIGLGD